MGVHVEDHFIVISTILARPDPVCQTCEPRNFKAMDLNAFRSKLWKSVVYISPCTEVCHSTNCAIKESGWKNYMKKLADTEGDIHGQWRIIKEFLNSNE